MAFNIKLLLQTIRDRRLELNYTQEYIAARIGVSQNAYSKLELNMSHLTVERFVAVCEALEMDVVEALSPSLKAA